MTFRDEKDFENHIRELLESEIAMQDLGFTILKYTGIADIIICRENPQAVFFIEVKYAKDMMSVTEGIQTEILSKMPPYIDNHLIWLLGSEKHDGQYWLLDSSEMVRFVSDAHNISRTIFYRGGLTKTELANRLREWLYG